MAAWHWAGFAISWEVLRLKVRANQEKVTANMRTGPTASDATHPADLDACANPALLPTVTPSP
ncbi:hypothetical protein WMO33_14575 [Xanthomonas oryzae pv. oryzicola]|uniref:hypothetical protein n=1 Tax=Xanthomonas oryzae TaxID=347 RepID=UPI000A46503E|nr:hypothetical protein [Xanthomonas oryzae]ULX23624.1 hypothetical protein IYN96_14670 [Xanthomonas oryzae pv. oryzicola]